MSRLKFLLPFWLIFCVTVVSAQTDCPSIVQTAFDTVKTVCADTNRNQVCYGNIKLTATPRDGISSFAFDKAGDRVNVTDIQSLELSSMSLADTSWSIALMQVQANLPDTLPGQNVTFLLFGDVKITDTSTALVELPLTTRSNANVRLYPDTSQNNILHSFIPSEQVRANGRLEDSSWVRIVLDDGQIGWISADLLTGEISRLSVVRPDELAFGPMQAFQLTSGVDDRPCHQAPDSGILVQTPKGTVEVHLRVNGVDIWLGSTVYLQAGGGFMTVSVVDGHAKLMADGVIQTVPAGTFAQIPLDTSGTANGAPTFPQPYDDANLQALPVAVALPQQVAITLPITTTHDIEVAIDMANELPPGGKWTITKVVTQPGCGNPPAVVGRTLIYDIDITFNEDHSVMHMVDGLFDELLMRSDASTYVWSGSGDQRSITFTSLTTFTGDNAQGDLTDTNPCVFHSQESGVFVG